MDDYEAIRHLLAAYCLATDNGDTERWVDCFTDDIVWEGGAAGRFDGQAGARAFHDHPTDAPRRLQHINTNHMIDLDGETATVRSYMEILMFVQSSWSIVHACYYDDQLIKIDGRWLIRRRALV